MQEPGADAASRHDVSLAEVHVDGLFACSDSLVVAAGQLVDAAEVGERARSLVQPVRLRHQVDRFDREQGRAAGAADLADAALTRPIICAPMSSAVASAAARRAIRSFLG
jgi:hypothetical protein